jgi:hypothetical protein
VPAVSVRSAAGIIDTVRSAVEKLRGPERIVTAITLALKQIRSDSLSQLMIGSVRGIESMSGITASPLLAGIARELSGLADSDPDAAHWIVRVVLSLVYWPAQDEHAERQLVQRFVTPAFT